LRRLLKKRGIEMQGNNTLILNPETMRKAVEFWLNGDVWVKWSTRPLEVYSVREVEGKFQIQFCPRPQPKEKPAK
jgi:hypothetical protein